MPFPYFISCIQVNVYHNTFDMVVVLFEKYGTALNYLITGTRLRDSNKDNEFNSYIAYCTRDDRNGMLAVFLHLWKIVIQYKL